MTAPGPAKPRRRLRWLFALLALAVGAALAVAVVEGAFRWCWTLPPAFAEFAQQGLYRQRADGSIALQPGYRGSLTVAGRTTEVYVDALGLRSAAPGAAAASPGDAAMQRWLMLGDSLVFGYGVAADEALPAQFARALAAAGRQVVVGNAGVPGYGLRDAVAAMANLDAAFGANAVVLCGYLGNDALDDLRVDQAVASGLRFDGPMARLVQSSPRIRLALASRAWLWLETWIFTNHTAWSPLLQQAPTAAELVALAGLPGEYPTFAAAQGGLFLDVADLQHRFQAEAPPVLPRLLANVEAALGKARALAAGRPLYFVVLPPRALVEEPLRQQRLRERGFAVEDFPRGLAQQRWLAAAAAAGVPALDATPVLAGSGDAAAWFVDDGHLSAAGAAKVAAALAEFVGR